MATMLRAFLRGYCWKVWPGFLAVLAAFVFFPWAFYGLLRLDGAVFDAEFISAATFYFVYLWVTLIAFGSTTLEALQHFSRRMYALPISTRSIVVWHMLAGALTITVGHLAICLSYYFLFGIHWPVGSMLATLVPGVMLLQCIYWSTLRFRPSGILVWVTAVILWCWQTNRFFPSGSTLQSDASLSAGDLLFAVMVTVVTYWLGVRWFGQHRCEEGDEWSLARVLHSLRSVFGKQAYRGMAARFTSPQSALSWYLWRRSGRGVFVAVGMVVAGLLIVGGVGAHLANMDRGLPASDYLEGLVGGVSMLSIAIGLVLGAILGMHEGDSRRLQMKAILSTAPVSDTDLARGLLANAFRATVLVWGMMMLAAFAHPVWALVEHNDGGIFGAVEAWQSKSPFGVATIPLGCVGTFLVVWTIASLFAAFGWTGRAWLFGGVILGLMLSTVAVTVVLRFVVSPENTHAVMQIIRWGIATLLVFGTGAAFVSSHKQRALELETVVLLLLAWGGMVSAVWFVQPPDFTIGILLSTLLLLPILPVAAVPLAVAWNRHR